MSLPPTLQEFYNHGPGSAVWSALQRRPGEINATLNRLVLPSHGLADDDAVELVPGPTYGGAGSLPSPLTSATPYYVRVISSSILELAATAGGAAIDFTGTGTHGLEVLIDFGPALTQELLWATQRFLACAADKGWTEPPAGWGGDVKGRICDLVAWPQLERRGYVPTKADGWEKRYWAAIADLCTVVPLGVDIPVDGGAEAPADGFGSSSWAEPVRGYHGQTDAYPRRRAVVS